MPDFRLGLGRATGPFRRQEETEKEADAKCGKERACRQSEEDEPERPMS